MLKAKAATGVIKFVVIAGLVTLLVWTVKTIYEDQVEVRERIIAESLERAQADAEVTRLTIITQRQEERAKEREAELEAAREAVRSLNFQFSAIKADQQQLLAGLRDVESELQTRPAPEVEAEANALMESVNSRMEGLFP